MTPRARYAALLAVLLGAALPASGQSVLAAGGLGMPLEPVDARGRALGSVGGGLLGSAVIPGDPVASADLGVPTVVLTLQSAWLDIEQGRGPSSVSGNRFPGLGVSYPVRDWGVLTLTYGAVLDQRWELERRDTLELGPSGTPLEIADRFRSDGGVSAVRIGFAHRVAPSLAVGAAVGVFTGNSTRAFTRVFDTIAADVDIDPFESVGHWSYSGPTASFGAMVDVGQVFRAAGTLTWSGTLEADPADGTEGERREYDMPLDLRAGLSVALAPELNVSGSFAWSDWSATSEDLDLSGDGKATALGAGIEYDRATLFGRGLPLRVGWHRATLPFQILDTDAVETAFSFGAGLMLLAREDGVPLALLDLGLETGSRKASAVVEDFWRSTMSIRVAGF
jgi:hypothetical protein